MSGRSRLEDLRLLQGAGRFVDDVALHRMLHARVVRSEVAHGILRAVDGQRALRTPGVHAVLTAAAFPRTPTIPMRLKLTADRLDAHLQPVLAADKVRYVGEPLAVVVADDPYVAEDAAERVDVRVDPQPCVLDAGAPDQHSLWDGTSNEVATLRMAFGDVDGAFARAAEVVRVDSVIGRHTAVPLEGRGLVADYDPGRGQLTVWGFTKVSHFNRTVLARLLGMSTSRIVVRSVDAGGGFGVRGEFYPEDFLVPYLAVQLRRPVKWVEDRSEHLVAANHSRDQRHQLQGAFDADGALLGLRAEVWHDTGAYLRTHGLTVPELTLSMLPGPYRVPAYDATIHVVTTNKTPAGTYRAPGRYEGTFARERLLDVAADRLGIDPVALRRRLLLRPDELPHSRPLFTLGTDVTLDAGDYRGLLDRAVTETDFTGWRAEAASLRRAGRLVGTGLAVFLEKSGLGPYETAEVRVDTSGAVTVFSGGASLGQGIETTMALIAAAELGVDAAAIQVVHGDSDQVPDGVGSWASRSTVVGGSAVLHAARDVAGHAKRVGAHLLGVDEDKVELADGRVRVRRTAAEGVTLGEVAAACEPLDRARVGSAPGLRGHGVFTVDHMTYPYGVHLAQVEVDPDTGAVTVRRYCVAYEVGRAISETLVRGQIVGGFAQGLGGALLEEFAYDPSGQPLATQFMDYLMPTAAETPTIHVIVREDAPSADNPLGAKGAGEGGTTAAGAALASAVSDALGRTDAVARLPMTPERVHALAARSSIRTSAKERTGS